MSAAPDLVANLVQNPRSRRQLTEQFRSWREADLRSVDAADLLDLLAKHGVENDRCLETLLELLFDHGLARPAIRKLLIDEQDVADVEQRTLAAVSLKLGSFEARSRFTTWLHSIAANEARMLIRTRSRRRESPAFDDELPDAPFFARLSTLLGNRDLVSRALASLPENQRQVLTLREVEGLEYHEISAHLGVPIGTVRSRLSRAREALAVAARASMT